MPTATARSRSALPLLGAALALLLPSVRGACADSLQTITIEAQRQQQLRREVDRFVGSTLVKPSSQESLLRWDSPVCPLVAGLTKEQAEFVLRRFSEIARAAQAPLAGESCAPNLYIIATPNPSAFLELWWQRDRRLFNTRNGVAAVKRFIATPRPVRVWYNHFAADPDAGSEIGQMLADSMGFGQGAQYPVNRQPRPASRLTYMAVRAIASAIVVMDSQQVGRLSVGQLADYVSLLSLAEINLDKDVGATPSILKVLSAPGGAAPAGLTAWDESLLHAVYSSAQKDRMQMSQIKTAVLNGIGAAAAH